jgi:hypothetical protein
MIIKLNEYISNTNFITFAIDKLFNKINSKIPNTKIKIDLFEKGDTWISFKIFCDEKDSTRVEKLIKLNTKIFLDNNLILGYKNYENYFELVAKNIYTKRHHPKYGFLYHSTHKDNLEHIAKNGLELKPSHHSKEWKNSPYLTYPPAIFATIPPKEWSRKSIKIITKNLPNKWWYDLNMYYDKHSEYVMTFEPIPPEYLEIWDNDNYKWVKATNYTIEISNDK